MLTDEYTPAQRYHEGWVLGLCVHLQLSADDDTRQSS